MAKLDPDQDLQLDRDALLRRDFFRLRRQQRQGRPASELQAAIDASIQLRTARTTGLASLKLDIPAELPLAERAEDIRQALAANQVVIVAGETGSGKTTQLPKMCLQSGLGVAGQIAHTQPRRLAARTVAKRIADETGSELGDQVGYAVRFSDQVRDTSLVKVLTDGLLLTEIRRDRFLDQYEVIIIDEAHERSLNIDFLLGYVKNLLARRDDLKVIVTSATIDVERFAAFFDGAPIIKVGGRTFPVDVRYQEIPENPLDAVVDVLAEIEAQPLGPARDVLVFFSGEREIFEAARELRRTFDQRLEILPLYARLSFAEQQKVFRSGSGLRRVILATNVAETSITVPNIGYVIDPGMARISRYSYRSKLQRLPIEPVSQASANQRTGRCGRIAPGVCYRLFTAEDFASRPEFTDPEIRRVNLAAVMLQMLAFNLGDIARFPFIDPPDPRAIKDARLLLNELQALEEGKLTPIGRGMARLPTDPRLGRMLFEANRQGALREMLIITAALAIQDPRDRPLQKAGSADQSHAEFTHEKSDFLSFLQLWEWLSARKQEMTNRAFAKLCHKRFLNPLRIREWRETHRQLRQTCRDLGYKENSAPANYQQIHESILSGSLSLIAQHDERGNFVGPRGLKVRIFPASGLAQRSPRWIVSGEVVETSRVFARQVAQVEPAWIEAQAQHLAKVRYSEPFWSLQRGEAQARKSVTLYGLRLADNRTVSYARIDPVRCRDLFLREGLVAGRLPKPPPFLQANLRTIAEVLDLEAKGRRRDLLVDEDEIYRFYAQRLPDDVCRGQDLHNWGRRATPAELEALLLTRDHLLRTAPTGLEEEAFPAELELAGARITLRYRFAPGDADDGVTLEIPAGVIGGISGEALEWLVPGLFPNLLEQWLRTLPKQKRRTLVPLPERVEELSTWLLHPERYRQGRLRSALQEVLAQRYRLAVEDSDWDRTRIAEHLLFYIRVVDADGKTVAAGRDLQALKERLRAEQPGTPDQAVQPSAPFRTLPADLVLRDHAVSGRGHQAQLSYPGLEDLGGDVRLAYFPNPQERDRAQRVGLIRLALNHLGPVGAYFRKELDKHPHLGLHFATLGSAADLKEALLAGVIWYCYFDGQEPVTDAEGLYARMDELRPTLAGVFSETVAHFAQVMALRFAARQSLEQLDSPGFAHSRADIDAHINRLAGKDLLQATPRAVMPLLPRYLRGIQARIEHLPGHVPKDRRNLDELHRFRERLTAVAAAELFDPQEHRVLWLLLEELTLTRHAERIAKERVTDHPLAVALGAKWKVSDKRMDEALLRAERRVGLR
ncbi:MAG: ATP-dependent RNA helicase HrpA [Pseudomonadota bacterium]